MSFKKNRDVFSFGMIMSEILFGVYPVDICKNKNFTLGLYA